MAWQVTHATHGELIQGVEPAESTHFSPAELNLCKINSLRIALGAYGLRVQELAQKECEAGGSGSKLNRSF